MAEYEKLDELGCKLLAAAIVEQAAKDALGWSSGAYKGGSMGKAQREQIKKFFCDKDSPFTMYMPKTDGRMLYNKIMDNYKNYGCYKPPMNEKEDDV